MSSEQNKDLCELAIKKTLAYRSVFKYPLSKFQLKTFLVTDKEFKNKTIEDALEHLIHRGFVKEKHKKYFLPGMTPVDWNEKKALTKKFINKNEKIFFRLGKIPWVKLIAITGSVAAYNTRNDSDIDVFIISTKNRLWLTRFFITLILKIAKKFPKKDGEKGKICTNLFLDEKYLSWDENKRNIFIAHDIVMMQPLVDKKNTYLRFLNANSWVQNYFAQFKINNVGPVSSKKYYSSSFMDFLEKLSAKIQIAHMHKKVTTEIISKNIIHFNKNDNSKKILDSYEKVLVNRKIS